MISQTKYDYLVIAPGREVTVNVTGASFHVESADARVEVKFDDGNYFPVKSGAYFNAPPDDFFSRLTFRNPAGTGGATVTVRYYAGTLPINNNAPTVISRPVPTYTVVTSYPAGTPLGSGGSVTVPPTNLRTGETVPDRLLRVRIEKMNSAIITVRQMPDDVVIAEIDGVAAWKEYDFPVRVTVAASSNLAIIAYYELPNL